MTAVFSHGRLRLYLLKLLAEGPKHGYELIRLLENRFLGLYAPSAGTIYPRLARLEAEGLVTHKAVGGRKVYEITDAGRDELAARASELAELESDIHASVADLTTLATEIEQQVSGSVRDLKRELREAAQQARGARSASWQTGRGGWGAPAPRAGGATSESESGWPTGAAGTGGDSDQAAAGQARSEPGSAAAELERLGGQLAAEVTRLARRAGAGEPELRAAVAVLNSALGELRRLLGR